MAYTIRLAPNKYEPLRNCGHIYIETSSGTNRTRWYMIRVYHRNFDCIVPVHTAFTFMILWRELRSFKDQATSYLVRASFSIERLIPLKVLSPLVDFFRSRSSSMCFLRIGCYNKLDSKAFLRLIPLLKFDYIPCEIGHERRQSSQRKTSRQL